MASISATRRAVAAFFIFIQVCHFHQNSVNAAQGTKKMDLTLLIDSTLDSSIWYSYIDCYQKILDQLSFEFDRMRVSIIGVDRYGQVVLTLNEPEAGNKYLATGKLHQIQNHPGDTLDIKNGISLGDSFPGRSDAPHTVLAVFHKSGIHTHTEVTNAAAALKRSKVNTNLMTIGLTSTADQNLLRSIATRKNNKDYYRYYSSVNSMCNAASTIARELYNLTPDDGTFLGTVIPGVTNLPVSGNTKQVTFVTGTTTTKKPVTSAPLPLSCVNSPCIKGSRDCPTSGDNTNVVLCAQPTDVCARYCYARLPKPNLAQKSKYPHCVKGTKAQTRVYISSLNKNVNVDVESACPNKGPSSGSTLYHIWGKGLNLPSLKIYFSYGASKRECIVLYKTDSFVQCRTPNINSLTSLKNRNLALEIYDNKQSVHSELNMFMFKQDPYVTSVSPTKLPMEGGRSLTVKGSGLGHISEAIYEVRVAYRPTVNGFNAQTVYMYASLCSAPNALGTMMVCPSPLIELPAHVTNEAAVGPITVAHGRNSNYNSVYYRVMDLISGRKRRAVSSAQVSSSHIEITGRLVLGGKRVTHKDLDKIELYQSPKVEFFHGEGKTYSFFPEWPNNEKHIEIPGNYLDAAASLSDYRVTIGEKSPCNVTEVTTGVIRCLAPDKEPPPAPNQPVGQDHPRVMIQYFGKTYFPGFVSYKGKWENNVFKYSLIAAVLILLLIIIVIVFVIIFCRLKRRQPRKETVNHYHTARSDSYKSDY